MTNRADAVRRAVTVVAAFAQAASPILLSPQMARTVRPPEVLQPAPATFAVWFPIFAVSLRHASRQAFGRDRDDPVVRSMGWPAAGAYTATAAWAPLVSSGRYWHGACAMTRRGQTIPRTMV